AGSEFLVDGGEPIAILAIGVCDLLDYISAFVCAGWDDPIFVTCEQDVESVWLLREVAALGFDGQGWFGDEAFECTLCACVVWSVGFVGEQEGDLAEVEIESACEVCG